MSRKLWAAAFGAFTLAICIVIFITGKTTAVGDVVRFGEYDWQVLAVKGNKALLITEDVIEKRPYNEEEKSITWEECSLRAYLNGEFLKTFSAEERAKIVRTRNENPDNTWGQTAGVRFNTPGGKPTEDTIFLLSVPEIEKYFPGKKLSKDVIAPNSNWYYEADEHLVAEFIDRTFFYAWWLRSPGEGSHRASNVTNSGTVSFHGFSVDYADGVRPALWLKLT